MDDTTPYTGGGIGRRTAVAGAKADDDGLETDLDVVAHTRCGRAMARRVSNGLERLRLKTLISCPFSVLPLDRDAPSTSNVARARLG